MNGWIYTIHVKKWVIISDDSALIIATLIFFVFYLFTNNTTTYNIKWRGVKESCTCIIIFMNNEKKYLFLT